MRYILTLCLFFSSLLIPARSEEERTTIYVSVAPYVQIVQYLAGNSSSVLPIVASSLSSHSFEPTPTTTLGMKNSPLWFGISEPFEAKLLDSLKNTLKSKIRYINLRHELQESLQQFVAEYPSLLHHTCHHHHKHCHTAHWKHLDPHIWMSPLLMKQQIAIIAKNMKETLPHIPQKEIDERTVILSGRCDKLIEYATAQLSPQHGKSILTAHPAYGYLIAPYNIEQYSLEEEGKELSAKALSHLIASVRKENISTIFTQSQYSTKGATAIMDHILPKDAKIVVLNPYSDDYFTALMHSVDELASALEKQEHRTIK